MPYQSPSLVLVAETGLCVLGILLTIWNLLIPGIAIFVCFAVIFIISKNKHRKTQINNDVYDFISHLIYWYKLKKSRLHLIESSLSRKFFFYNDVTNALVIYRNCGNAKEAFKHINTNNSFYLRQVLNLIAQCIDSGIDIYSALNEIKKQFDIERKYEEGMHKETQSSVSMMQIGSSVFFPIFSGISMNILKFTSQMNGVTFNFWSFSVLFIAYIITIAFINFRYKDSNLRSKAENIMLLALFSVILFKASSSAISHSLII